LGKTAAGLVRPDLPRALETLQLAAERLETPAITFDRGFANVFTAIVLQKYPLLKELAEEIAALTTRAVHMTGSGPTLFICAETEACAGQLADLITAKINQPCREQNSEKLKVSVWTASSVTHGAKVSSSTLAEA
jgi:4-diphosphocytidyl-2C-methyl-D-erythritol kinase